MTMAQPSDGHGQILRVLIPQIRLLVERDTTRVKEITPESRLIQDLGFDSLALLELTVALAVDFEVDELPASLINGDWTGVTVDDVVEICLRAESARWRLNWHDK